MTRSTKTLEAYHKLSSYYATTHANPLFVAMFKIFRQRIHGRRVIDLGCGTGRDAILFLQNGFDYLGIDVSSAMLREARKRVKGGNFRRMDLYHLNFPANSFDGFWASASLLHITQRRIRKVLRSIRQLLKPGGVGFISLKAKTTISEGVIHQDLCGGVDRFFAFYTKAEFGALLREAGYRILETRSFHEDATKWRCFFVARA